MVIYKITNLLNGKIYIGKDLFNNQEYFGSGILIKNAILKYGKDNFKREILEYVDSRENLNDREKYWIKELNAQNREIGYNIHNGGDGGDTFSGKHHSEESKKKSKDSNKKSWSNLELRDKHSKIMKIVQSREDVKEKKMAYWTEDKRKERSELIKSKMDNPRKESISKLMKEIKKKPIICDGIRYDSISEACNSLNMSWYLITKNLKNKELINWYKL
jgi:group I intron endonuclease